MNAAPLKCALLALLGAVASAQVPGWWKRFVDQPRMETAFTQESESAVFGKLKRKGLLRLAKGGRIRVEYQPGLLLVADGKSIIQYDPQAHTAQRTNLRGAAKDSPLLWLLLDPGALEAVYAAKAGPGPDAFTLEPRKPGLPRLDLEGRGGLPSRIGWTDPTGARQVILFQGPRVPAAFDQALFTFTAPAGTRWIINR